ncbi:cytochrome bd-I oxidase subunit CydX [Pseudothauera hydrothermalis]|nr:cytochrome bd-I oxidase subunit CydX [Pseudothauera hydrothermalis]
MWYFTWMLGIGFAVLLAILDVLWMENEDGRRNSLRARREGDDT